LAATPHISARWRIPLLAVTLTAVVVTGMIYVVTTSTRTYTVHLPLVNASMTARVEATEAHLALDELATGRYGKDTEAELWARLASAEWHLRAMRDGASGSSRDDGHAHDNDYEAGWNYIPLDDRELDTNLGLALRRLDTLRTNLATDLPDIIRSGLGPGANQAIEGQFHAYMISVDRMDERLHTMLADQFRATNRTQGMLIAGTTLLGLIAALLLFRFDTERERATQRARANDRQLINVVLNGIGEGVVAFDMRGQITTMNRAAQSYMCAEHPEDDRKFVTDLCMGPCGGGRLDPADLLSRIHAAGGPVGLEEVRIQCKHSEPRYLAVIVSPLRDETGALSGGVISIRDVTESKRMEQALLASEARHEQAQRIAGLGHWDWNITTGTLMWSNEIYSILGLDPVETAPDYELFTQMIHPDDRAMVQEAVRAAVEDGAPYHAEHRVVRPDGSVRTVLEQGEASVDRVTGLPVHMMGTTLDITERKELERKLEELAITDGLTGLFNRRHFDIRLDEEFRRAVTYYDLPVSLLMIDVDHFKQLNDTHGHQAGDAWLKALADLLRRSVRTVDLVARYGGEEIAVILPQTPGKQAMIMAERIRKGAERLRVEWNGTQVHTTVSIGLADPRELELPACEMLLEAADRALYQAKQTGRNQVVRAHSQQIPENRKKTNTRWISDPV